MRKKDRVAAIFADDFLRGYMSAICWLVKDEDDNPVFASGGGSYYMDRNELARLTHAALDYCISGCESFLASLTPDERAAVDADAEDAGVNFYLTRNHHGCGFWDTREKWSGLAGELTNKSHACGETYESYWRGSVHCMGG